jgi:large repetitive protein
MRSITSLAVLIALSAASPARATSSARDALLVLVDPAKGVLIRWSMPPGPLPPGGFRLDRSLDGGPAVTLATLRAAQPEVAAVGEQNAAIARKYLELTAAPAGPGDQKKREELDRARFAVELRSYTDLALARALGVAFVDTTAPAGAKARYTVTALGLDGKAEVAWASGTFTLKPSPTPTAPVALKAASMRGEVELTWDAAPGEADQPHGAVTYQVLRRLAAGGELEPVGKEPIFVRTGTDPTKPRRPDLRDPGAPTEQRLVYVVRGLDFFGRPGAVSAPVEVFHLDYTANDPPRKVTIASEPGQLRVSWETEQNPHTAGFQVRRSLAADGPWDLLTAKPVKERTFADTTGQPGSAYYYQVAAVNPRGESGQWSPPVRAELRAKGPPAAPADLTAERLTGKIVLRWTPGNGAPVRGFRVEREAGDKVFAILRDDLAVEPRFEDKLPPDAYGVMTYRVVAVGLDGQVSRPSAALPVPLPLTRAPTRPEITGISGAGGRVKLDWRATGERGEAAGFLVLRAIGKSDEGSVITPTPLKADAVSFVDEQVVAGSTYFYRVVTVDSAGNRSLPAFSASVRVGDPALPPPPPPRLRYQATPFPRVVAEFEPPRGASVRWRLERRDAAGRWIPVTAAIPAESRSALDTHALRGRAAYRLTATATNGVVGSSSAPVEIEVP